MPLKLDRLRLPAALDVRQKLNEAADAIGPVAVEFPLPITSLKVIKLPLARALNPMACRNFTSDNLLGIPLADRDVIISYPSFAHGSSVFAAGAAGIFA